jgi:protein-L-isoaspartate(D-aspartate) O-methyltransferase
MTSMLKVNHGSRILEIGTGSGYQATLLFLLGAKVFTIERIPQLYENANRLFKKYSINVITRLGDGTLGWKEFAPFDGIIITAAAPDTPTSLLEQLANGGRMVVPVGEKNIQTMLIIEKSMDGVASEIYTERFKFVPLIGKEGWSRE